MAEEANGTVIIALLKDGVIWGVRFWPGGVDGDAPTWLCENGRGVCFDEYDGFEQQPIGWIPFPEADSDWLSKIWAMKEKENV